MLEYQTSGVTGRKETLTQFFQLKKNGAGRIQLEADVTQVGGALTESVNYIYFLKVQDGLAESAVVGNEYRRTCGLWASQSINVWTRIQNQVIDNNIDYDIIFSSDSNSCCGNVGTYLSADSNVISKT